MIWHPWADWVTTEPVTGPTIRWASIDTVVIHYTAAINLIDGDPGEDWGRIPAYLRSIHHEYLTNRPQPSGATGYAVGYNAAVDARGEAWELRGWNIKCAANIGQNDHTWAILVLVDDQSPVTDEAAATIRELVRLAEQRAMRQLMVKGHRDLAATQCPGTGVYAQIQAGDFKPQVLDKPRPPVPAPAPVPSEEDDMPAPDPKLIRFKGTANELLFACNTFTHGTAEQIGEWRALYGTPDRQAFVWEAHPQAMKGAFAKAGLDPSDIAHITE